MCVCVIYSDSVCVCVVSKSKQLCDELLFMQFDVVSSLCPRRRKKKTFLHTDRREVHGTKASLAVFHYRGVTARQAVVA